MGSTWLTSLAPWALTASFQQTVIEWWGHGTPIMHSLNCFWGDKCSDFCTNYLLWLCKWVVWWGGGGSWHVLNQCIRLNLLWLHGLLEDTYSDLETVAQVSILGWLSILASMFMYSFCVYVWFSCLCSFHAYVALLFMHFFLLRRHQIDC